MVDPIDVDDALGFVDPVDDPVRPDSRGEPTFELSPKWVPDSMRVAEQAPEAELDDGAYDTWRGRCEAVELAHRRRRPPEPVLIHGTSGCVPPPS